MSRETDALIRYVKAVAGDVVVTATVGTYISSANPCSPHAAGSYHCRPGTGGPGLAVDFGGTPTQQAAAFDALRPVAGRLAELIHNPAGAVKNGRWVDPLAVYGPTVWAAHANHTHVAVGVGVFLAVPPPPVVADPPVPTATPADPVHDFEEAAMKQMFMHIGPLDAQGNGWADWDPGLGRDPIIYSVVQQGPSPPDDGYWPGSAGVNISAQPRGGKVRVTIRRGTPGDTVSCWVSVA